MDMEPMWQVLLLLMEPCWVAPEAKMLAVKVLSKDGFGSYSDIVQGLKWVRDWTGPGGER